MNILLETGKISTLQVGTNLAYVLNDHSNFLPTEYKVMLNQDNTSFVDCMKILYNGKIELFYLTNQYKTLYSLIPNLSPDNFLMILGNLFTNIISAKSIGFLSCQNIDISLENIYINPTTYKVSLIYFPLNIHLFDDYLSFENELRTSIVKLINSASNLSDPRVSQLAFDLSDGTLTLEDLCNKVKGKSINKKIMKPVVNQETILHLVAMNVPGRIEVIVNKNEFVIGKKKAAVDGCFTFNDLISRVHCKINKTDNGYTITDLKSANGTYVNNVRLMPNKPYPIKDKDIVRLANSNFQIMFE